MNEHADHIWGDIRITEESKRLLAEYGTPLPTCAGCGCQEKTHPIETCVTFIRKERDYWEAEHAAIFHIVLSEDAAVAIAKCFAGHDDLAWQRLEPYDRLRITERGERVVRMLRHSIGG